MATAFDGLYSVDSWRAELRRPRDVEDPSALVGIWEISVNIAEAPEIGILPLFSHQCRRKDDVVLKVRQ